MKVMKIAMAMALSVVLGAGSAAAQEFSIIAPASPGGGWDQTARAIQSALQENGLARSVQVMNVPGAGGTIGLAQFVAQSSGDPNAFILGGYGMVAPIIANRTAVSLDDVTPIARLTGEHEVIVVPTSSSKTMDDLVAALKADVGAVSWAGGSAGGVDHVAAGLIAKAAGVDPTKVNYVAFAGGGEALSAILGGQVTVGISGSGEFESLITAGRLRALGVTATERLETLPEVPTLREQNLDVVFQNWRMIAAAPGITDEQKANITKMIETMVKSDNWQEALRAKGWQDTYLAGDEFAAYLKEEFAQTEAVLKSLGLAK